ncbi:Prp18p [Sugiyamaella lignohabitans]|uniref:Pre-mRNA-splicing factor 18 n=1 Tax=Sugiyamaella lignohabitans TaxID=796027 RepID=A0A167BZQ1_9ASCO|nr:Prp18p [Sugiyamaella lignohabitans]ANB11026.1 Prp18p [Sugiyamaella lignohabitans]
MDFSALLAKEIAKKKAQAAAVTNLKTESADGPGQKPKSYVRKAELEELREKEYRKEQEAKQAAARKRQLEQELEHEREKENEAKRLKRRGNDGSNSNKSETERSDSEIIARLEELNEPTSVPGESEKGRKNRLARIEKKLELQERLRKEEEEDARTDPTIVPQDIKDNEPKVYIQMRVYIKQLLRKWELYLEQNQEETKSIYKEASKDIEILLGHLRNKSLSKQIFPSLATLLYYLQTKKFRDANDTYIQLSIGNVAWPIGVIGVAIHERSAQSKITGIHNTSSEGSVQIAHIMSDDETRRWLTAVKRLITFCEKTSKTSSVTD